MSVGSTIRHADASVTVRGIIPTASTGLVQSGTAANAAVTPASLRGGYMVFSNSALLTSTAVSFGGIPSWAKQVDVLFWGLATNGGNQPRLRLVDGGGVLSSGYTGAGFMAGNTVDFSSLNGIGLVANVLSGQVQSGVVTLHRVAQGQWIYTVQSSAANTNAFTGAGFINFGANDLTGVQFTINGTNVFTAGSAVVRWV